MPLWWPRCDGRNYTRPPGGKVGFSAIEVVCDDCGHRFWFAINIGAQLARHEADLQAQQGPRTPEAAATDVLVVGSAADDDDVVERGSPGPGEQRGDSANLS